MDGFEKLKYDIHKVPIDQECLSRYKDLEMFGHVFGKDDLPDDITADFVLRYLILTYTPSSPFTVYTDLVKRKPRVLEYLGIKTQADVTPSIEDMCQLNGAGYMMRFIFFLRAQFNEDWELLCMSQERYARVLKDYLTVTNDALAEQRKQAVIKELVAQIKEARKNFMAGEKAKHVEEAITFSVVSESLNIRPEEYIPIYATTGRLPYNLTSL